MEKGDDDPVKEKAIDKKPEYETYQQLLKENGRKGDELVSSLLSKVFDDDTRMIEQHLSRYYEFLVKDNILKSKDINQGLSRFSDLLAELVLDCPQIHKYLMDFLIKPLREKNIVQYKFITWKFEKPKKEDDDEDIVFGTNPFYKLLAHIMVDMKDNMQMSWTDISQSYDRTWNWRSVAEEKFPHIEDEEDLWNEIKEEVGEANAGHILPLLNKP